VEIVTNREPEYSRERDGPADPDDHTSEDVVKQFGAGTGSGATEFSRRAKENNAPVRGHDRSGHKRDSEEHGGNRRVESSHGRLDHALPNGSALS
jgi:hypothetical protein